MTAAQNPSFSTDPLSSFDLDTLLSGAARLRGDRLAIGDGQCALSFAELDAHSNAIAIAWTDMGLQAGETLMILAGARVSAVIALVAGLRAGLRVALAPLHLEAEALGALARTCGAVALVADGTYGDLLPIEDCLGAAAAAPRVRLICTLDGSVSDGAVSLDPAALADVAGPHARSSVRGRSPLVTFDATGAAIEHQQRTLVAAGLDLLARGRIGMRLPILSTLAPASFAGLVAGPLGSFLAGAPLQLLGPFEAQAFIERLERCGPCHLVVPAGLLRMCEAAGIVSAERVASLLLLSRAPTAALLSRPVALAPSRGLPPVLDVYAIGEIATMAEPRGIDGEAADLFGEAHYISIDERRILAAGWVEGSDQPRIEGAAVSLAQANA